MSVTNGRIKDCETVHHLINRIAHRVRILEDDERNDLLEYVRRTSEFAGIKLIGWCIMSNHFHLLVYLPCPEELSESEILRRYGVLKGVARCDELARRFDVLRRMGESGEQEIAAILGNLRRRMYDIGEFMKTVKQWFSEEYNARNGHKGTLWESAYHDKIVPRRSYDMSRVLAYQHINPLSAAITDQFDGYAWSSYTAYLHGDHLAAEGLRFVYGDELTDGELIEVHIATMRKMLGEEKERRAIEIARKRAAGFSAPCDPLTDEVLVAKAMANINQIQAEYVDLRRAREAASNRNAARRLACEQIIRLLQREGGLSAVAVGEKLGMNERMAQRCLAELERQGRAGRSSRCAPWRIVA